MEEDALIAARDLLAYYERVRPAETLRRRYERLFGAGAVVAVAVTVYVGVVVGGVLGYVNLWLATIAAVVLQRVVVSGVTARRAWSELTVAAIHARAYIDAWEALRSHARPDA